MLGIYLLLSYEVMGCLHEVLKSLVKHFISTPRFSRTTYNTASSHTFSPKVAHYSNQETTAAISTVWEFEGYSKRIFKMWLCLWAAQTYVHTAHLNQSKVNHWKLSAASFYSVLFPKWFHVPNALKADKCALQEETDPYRHRQRTAKGTQVWHSLFLLAATLDLAFFV